MNDPLEPVSRGWLQYSLKSVLILIAVVAAFFAGLALMMRRAQRQVHQERVAREQAEKLLKDSRDEAIRAQAQAVEARDEAQRFAYLDRIRLAAAMAKQAPKPKQAPAKVQEFPATVTEVIDGDTVKIKMPSGKTDTVRFALCDAPEKGQPHGDAAKKFVEDACLNNSITIRTTDQRDNTQSKRLIAEIILRNGTSLNRELIRLGHAWWFYHYSNDASVGKLEAEAKAARRGVFSSETPIYPRNWRRGARVGLTKKAPHVFILALFPNPVGEEEEGREAVILANSSDKDVSVEGWKLLDDDMTEFTLAGSVPAGSARTFTVKETLRLANGGDVVTLTDAGGAKVQTVQYGRVDQGEFVMPPR